MSALSENAITRLGSVTGINMQTAGGAQTLFTVPPGKSALITHVIIRATSATLAGGTSYAFTSWRSGIDLSGMTTATTSYRVLPAADNTSYTRLAAGTAFQITPTTGSTGAATATVAVFGYLV